MLGPMTGRARGILAKTLRVLGALLALLLVVVGVGVALTWAPDRPLDALVARWAPPPSQFVEVKGMKVHLRDEGPRDDPAPIVLLHGTSASLHTWEGWATALRPTRRVIRFDLPGFGLTGPSPDGVYAIESYVAFVVAVLDHLHVQRCVIGGNSFGGHVSLAVTLAHPARVTRLILVDAAGYPSEVKSMPLGFRLARTPVLNRLASVSLPRRLIESSLRNVYGDPAKVTPELVDLYFALAVRAGNRKALVARFEQAPSGPLAARFGEIRVPTLVLWGGRDRLIPPSHGARFEKDIAGSKLVTFDDLGHVPQEEGPDRTVSAVQAFLSSN